jgi:hypothetical protein
VAVSDCHITPTEIAAYVRVVLSEARHILRWGKTIMADEATVSRYAVALVVLGGAAWTVAGIAFGATAAACYPSCGSGVAAPGSTAGYPPQALLNLTWDQLYINLYAAAIGLLAVVIGLKPFRRGERWAWYSVLVFVVIGVITNVFDYLSWEGWYTGFFAFLPWLLGLLLSAKSFFPRESPTASPT